MKIELVGKKIAVQRRELDSLLSELKSLLQREKKFISLKRVIKMFTPLNSRSSSFFYKTLDMLKKSKDFKVIYLHGTQKHHYYVGLRDWKESVDLIKDLPKIDRVRTFLEEHPDEVFTTEELTQNLNMFVRAADLDSLPRVKVGRINYYGCESALKKFREYLKEKGVQI